MILETLSAQVFNGLFTGALYALVTLGVTVVFGLTRLVNFAHGQLVIMGAFIALLVGTETIGAFLLALALATCGIGLLGAVLERSLFRRTLEKPINGFVISLGLILIFQSALFLKFGTYPQTAAPPVPGAWELGGVLLLRTRVVVLVVAVGLALAFYGFLRWTLIGTALRACSVDREVAGMMGIPAQRLLNLAFAIGSGLAGAAGALLAVTVPFSPFLGMAIVVKGFVIALAGGLGSVAGALILSFILGISEAVMIGFGWGRIADVAVFAFLIGMLVLRPQGLVRGTN